MEVLGWIFVGFLAVFVLLVLGLTIGSIGDLRRYIEIRRM